MNKTAHILAGLGVTCILLAIVIACTPGGSEAPPTPAMGTPGGNDAPANTLGAEVISIPGGTFWMGSDPSDALADTDEFPAHQVTLSGYSIYTHEVTNGQYANCVEAGECSPIRARANGPLGHASDPAYGDYPVVGVTWEMADTYCAWAGGRLPTEAEWEYAARGADSLLYPWGAEQPACDRVNMAGCATPPGTMLVGSFALGNSPFGLWDMSGNVWEWTQDWYAEAFYSFSPASDPIGPHTYQDADRPLKVVRGGGLDSNPVQMRSAMRLGIRPYRAYNDVGFRCVTGSSLALPDDYTQPDDLVEFVGGDEGPGAEDPEDPADNWLHAHYGYIHCPDEDNQILVDISLDAPEGTTYTVRVGEAIFDCLYDPDQNKYHCTGPAPEGLSEMDKVRVYVDALFPDGSTDEVGGFYIAAPHDCEETDPSPVFTASVSCPEDGWVTATFTYDASDVTWQEVYLRSMDTPLACEVTGEGVLTCLAPDISEDGFYEFYLYGENDEGLGRKRWPDVPAPEGCPADDGEFAVGVETGCFLGDIPTATFYYDESMHGSVKTVQDAGEYRLHMNWSDGVTESMYTDETPGLVTTMTLCFQDGFCMDVPEITVPACPGDISAITMGYTVSNICVSGFLGTSEWYPGVDIRYWPDFQHLESVSSMGNPLECSFAGGNRAVCAALPGNSGDSVAVDICFEDGRCYSETTTVNDCPTSTAEPWTFNTSGCHPWPEPNYVFFTVDTHYDWLTEDTEIAYTATDGIRVYTCVTHPSVPGRVYCYGLKPQSVQTLKLCLQVPGEPSDCQSFPDYFNWVSSLICPEPTPVVACSQFTTRDTCTANPACRWSFNPAGPSTCVNK